MYIAAQGPCLRNDLYCVEWDVKLYYTIRYRRQTNQQHCRHNLLGSGDESTYVDAQYVKTLLLLLLLLLLPGGYH